jgi:hypothetical protein
VAAQRGAHSCPAGGLVACGAAATGRQPLTHSWLGCRAQPLMGCMTVR